MSKSAFAVALLLVLGLLASCGRQASVPQESLETAALAAPAFSSTLVAQNSGKCLNVPFGYATLGLEIIQYSCDGKTSQRFTFHPVAGKTDTYILKNEDSGLCADVSLSKKEGGDFVVHQWSCHAKANQQFRLKATGTAKVFSLVANHDGKCVTVSNSSPADRAKVVSHGCSGAKNQLWKIAGYQAGTADSVTLVAAGDIACDPASDSFNGGAGTTGNCHMRATADLIAAAKPDAVLVLGDNQYERGTLSQFKNSFDLSWGRFKSLIRPAVGNHEYLTSGAAGYFDYFGARAGARGKGYYSYDVGAVAHRRAELQLWRGRRLQDGFGPGKVAARRLGSPPQEVYPRLLAPPPLQFGRARQQQLYERPLASTLRRWGRGRALGPRPRLRALRAARRVGPRRRARSAPVRGGYGRQKPLCVQGCQSQQPGSAQRHLRRFEPDLEGKQLHLEVHARGGQKL